MIDMLQNLFVFGFPSNRDGKGVNVEMRRNDTPAYSICSRPSSFFLLQFCYSFFCLILIRSFIADRIANAIEMLNLSLFEVIALRRLH